MSNNALDMLKDDHKKVKTLLEELVETSDRAVKKRQRLLKKIENELDIHTTIEEKVFYPAFRKKGDSKEETMFFEATEEHRAVDKLVLPDLLDTKVSSKKFKGRAKVLKEMIEHHADEEEEEMFPKVKKLMSKKELAKIGKQMEKLKKELTSKKQTA